MCAMMRKGLGNTALYLCTTASCLIKWVEDWEKLIGCFGAHKWSKIKQYQYQGGEDEVENKEMVVVKVKRKTEWQKAQQC